MAAPKKRVHVQEDCRFYIVRRLVNTVEPNVGDELTREDVERLINEGVEVTVTKNK
jgi:hypothetical protein